MLSINIYECILRSYIDLEEYVSNYTKGEIFDECRYIHECPFCHEQCFFVDINEEDLGNSIYYCYGCDIQSEDIIDFNSRIKKINKYESIMDLFNDLKKRNNAESVSDYEFALNIVKPSDFCYEDFEERLNCYMLNETYKNPIETNYIEYLIDNAYYDDVDIELLNNPEYVYKLWKKEQSNDESSDYSFFYFIHPKLRSNKDFWIKMCKEDTNVFRYVSDELKNDSDFIIESINENSHQEGLEQYIGDKLKNDKEFIIKMLQKNENLFTRINEKFRDDKDVVLSLFDRGYTDNNESDTDKYKTISIVVAEPLLPYVSERLRNDKDVIIAAINDNWWEFEFVPEEYKQDKNIIENMLKQDVRSFQYVDNTIKENDEYIKKLLKKYLIPLEHTNKRIQAEFGKDKEFMKREILRNKGIKYLSNELKEDKEYILELVKSNIGLPLDIEFISPKLKDDYDFMIEIIKKDVWYFEYASNRLRNNKDFVLKVIKLPDFSYEDTEYIGDKLMNDEEIRKISYSLREDYWHW